MKKVLFYIFCLFLFNNSAIAVIEVDITRGNLDPLPVAISPLHLESGSKDIKQGDKIIKNVGERISELIETNLRRSGLFNPLKKDSFVKIYNNTLPSFSDVVKTNNIAINIFEDYSKKKIIIVSCIDNLIKGAAGQAIQNMNIMFGFTESESLI